MSGSLIASKIKKYSIVIFLLGVVAIIYTATQFGEKSPIVISGQVKIDKQLQNEANGITTLFIIIFDAESSAPMPFGAYKDRISLSDATEDGILKKFIITREKLQVMFPDKAFPDVINVKARLDIDGIAGRDQDGDFVGFLNKVKLGSTDIEVVIAEKISEPPS
ncbi:MAG: hypothetical protein KBD78_00595 [Oligoflexales bacterium]|nr:hypothetical protein [Oligoflexales bacterium]